MTGTPIVQRVGADLQADQRRVVARLFLPGEELARGRSRVDLVVERVMALPEETVEQMAADLLRDFGPRHHDYVTLLERHAAAVRSHLPRDAAPTRARTLVLGASFTMEYAVEGAALCNPSPVPHPDQTGLAPGQLRVALSLRAVGEGHVSSIGFATAVVGPGTSWVLDPRERPAVTGTVSQAPWSLDHLRSVLADRRPLDQLASSVLSRLPDPFTTADLHATIDDPRHDGLHRRGGRETADFLRLLVSSAYQVDFPDDVSLTQRVLTPVAAEERNGIEDARFVLVTAPDGSTEYRATWTAYDGRQIAPRLLTSPDLRTFRMHRLAGPAARNKGMALFPRPVGGRHLALCRSDGESTSLASSVDGLTWSDPVPLQQPSEPWELVQIGNCGSPIETADGWLVLTHGVGPMRTYALGAMLLDLDDPTQVLRRLREPLLRPAPDEVEGYVPQVVYTCGGLLHDGVLWIPFGIGDVRIDVAHVDLAELIAAMT